MAGEEGAGEGGEGGGNDSARRPSWAAVPASEPVVSTVLLELAGLALYGVVALVGWLIGWQPSPHLAALTTSFAAVGPAAELYHAGRPPRRLAVTAALSTLVVVSLLGAAATSWVLPPAADQGIALLVGYVVALPVGVAVLARFLGPAQTP
ncbi:hypothetical protein ABT147_24575 [Streptomyces sp. NPDC001868]|uniref:hypothetical protein n=1 Tax=Streptomyces sp. NPDC001868 TaxID=3154401 RepID=UPI0033222772